MKKLSVTIGSIFIGGMLMAGCSEQSEEVPSQKEVLAEIVNEVRENFKPQTGPFSKYKTVKEYIIDIANKWVNEADTSEKKAEVLNDALAYADYFQDEIAEMGLKEDFDKLQLLGSEIINKSHENEGNEERWDRFYNQIGEILSQIDGTMVSKKYSSEDAERLAQLKRQTVTHTEYMSLENFMIVFRMDCKKPSIKRSKIANPKSHLAFVTIPYVNYFEHEITELGLNADFEELQLMADDVIQREHEEGLDFEKHINVFKDKLSEIIRKIHEKSRFDDGSSWATASLEILSEPLGRFDENAKIATWRARKVAFSFPIHLLSDDLETEEEKIHSKTFLLYSEININYFVADSARHYDEIWAKYDELKQYIEDLANEYQ